MSARSAGAETRSEMSCARSRTSAGVATINYCMWMWRTWGTCNQQGRPSRLSRPTGWGGAQCVTIQGQVRKCMRRGRGGLRRLGCRHVCQRWRWCRREADTASSFRVESSVTAVTQTAALRTGGGSCQPATSMEQGSLSHDSRHGQTGCQATNRFLPHRDPGTWDPARSWDCHGLLFGGSPRERLPAADLSIDKLRRRKWPRMNKELLKPMFCQRRDFVDAEVLLMLRFCWCWDFVDRSILSNNVEHIKIINLSKPSHVLTARYLMITVSNMIKVSQDHTHIV
jgi:hypothetical protein